MKYALLFNFDDKMENVDRSSVTCSGYKLPNFVLHFLITKYVLMRHDFALGLGVINAFVLFDVGNEWFHENVRSYLAYWLELVVVIVRAYC